MNIPFRGEFVRCSIVVIMNILAIHCFAQTSIPLYFRQGVYFVPCRINDVNMDFVFDTGASDIVVSESVAQSMRLDGKLKYSDYLGEEYYQIADGQLLKGTRIRLNKFCIGEICIQEIEAVVVNTSNALPLLGQNFLKKLGNYSVDHEKVVLNIDTNVNSFESLSKSSKFISSSDKFSIDFGGHPSVAETADRKMYSYTSVKDSTMFHVVIQNDLVYQAYNESEKAKHRTDFFKMLMETHEKSGVDGDCRLVVFHEEMALSCDINMVNPILRMYNRSLTFFKNLGTYTLSASFIHKDADVRFNSYINTFKYLQ
ncbi:MAG: retroviral-like aspartic protease family protein [Flavobacteriales bacterium]|nr:retroviral-like aspartic protease family protein [Flavobacteriales bacterium]